MDKKHFGDIGENYALNLLRRSGYKIITTKYRTRLGEIDIIAQDKDTLVFVEVKTRASLKYGKPQEAVNTRKMHVIKNVGELYIKTHPIFLKKLRIDVVAIEVSHGTVLSAKIIKVT